MKALCTLAQFEQCAEPKNAHDNIRTFGVTLDSHHYIILYQEHAFTAFINRCPHLHIPLEWQEHHFIDQDTQLLRCATHGALFMPESGECISGPCEGDALRTANICVLNKSIYLKD